MSAGRTVTIAGREFELGAVYAPVRTRKDNHPRRLLTYDPAYLWPDGRVEVETVPSAVSCGSLAMRRWLSGKAWAAWAGEEVEDDFEDSG